MTNKQSQYGFIYKAADIETIVLSSTNAGHPVNNGSSDLLDN